MNENMQPYVYSFLYAFTYTIMSVRARLKSQYALKKNHILRHLVGFDLKLERVLGHQCYYTVRRDLPKRPNRKLSATTPVLWLL